MTISSNKSFTTSIALFLMLAFAASLIICLPTVNAQQEQWKESYALIMAEPDPVGVGQCRVAVAIRWEEVCVSFGLVGGSG